jgi:hypothetical protein
METKKAPRPPRVSSTLDAVVSVMVCGVNSLKVLTSLPRYPIDIYFTSLG